MSAVDPALRLALDGLRVRAYYDGASNVLAGLVEAFRTSAAVECSDGCCATTQQLLDAADLVEQLTPVMLASIRSSAAELAQVEL